MFGSYDSDYDENKPYPYITTEKLTMKNVRTASGREIKIANNMALYKNLEVETDGAK
jgi:hypothetical protein